MQCDRCDGPIKNDEAHYKAAYGYDYLCAACWAALGYGSRTIDGS